ncbi:MAG: tRNA (N6-isopentenyl adenosine(37)-C2)-methylthiotransferase MiaB [Elusimicrobiota bacterium]
MKLFTQTFGCQMNFADSDEMGRHFKERGFAQTQNLEEADAVLVNTCTVRELAEHKAMSFIGRMKEWKLNNPNGLLIVTGCAAERAKVEMKRKFPHIDLIVGAKDIEEFPYELDKSLKPLVEDRLIPEPVETTPNNSVVQYVTIMRGCNYSCTYCIVPSVRGREVYRPVETILQETEARVTEGAKEIWLLGQTVNSYKPQQAPSDNYFFPELLRDVAKINGLQRLRFISPHPYYLNENLIQAMAETPNVPEYMHLPVQSGSDSQLKKMKRNYTRSSYMKGVLALRKAIPNIVISSDIIVGFPGETIADFEETLSVVKEAGFDSAYCFKYSPRPGTESADKFPDDVPNEEKERRVNLLLELTDSQGQANAKKLIGSVQEVLIEEDKGDGVFRGKTRGAWRMRIKNPTLKPGDIVQAKVIDTYSRELHGEVV